MKLDKEKHIGFAINVNKTQKFSITQSDHMFEILSDKIYNDKIKAIIRELSTNALDSHIDAKKEDSRFRIWLPKFKGDEFKIRDYGTGLTRDQIFDVYTNFGCSLRSNSNEFHGMYGLGSKTPLSYSKLVTVTSFYNNRKHVFVFDTTESGIPQVHEMSKNEGEYTEAENGLEISFRCNEDWNDFNIKARQVFQFFDEKDRPFIGNSDKIIEVDPILWDFEDDDFKFRIYNGGYGLKNHGTHLVMRPVGYPVDSYHIKNITKLGSYFELWIYADIGSCDINAGRESLRYTQKTIDYVEKRINEIYEKICIQLQNKFSNIQRNIDFIIDVNKSSSLSSFMKNIKFNNKDYDNIINECVEIIKLDDNLKTLNKSNWANSFSVEKNTLRDRPETRFKYLLSRITSENSFSLIYQDEVNGYKQKIDHNLTSRLVLVSDKEQTIKDLAELLGVEYLVSSKMESPPIDSNYSSNAKKSSVFKLDRGAKQTLSSSFESTYWEESEVDFNNDSGFYVEINNYKINGETPNQLINKIQFYELFKNKIGDVYGIKTKTIPKLKKSTGAWIDLVSFLDKENKSIIEDENLYYNIKNYDNFKNKLNKTWSIYRDSKEVEKYMEFAKQAKNGALKDLYTELNKAYSDAKVYYDKYNKSFATIENIAKNMTSNSDFMNYICPYIKSIKKIKEKYPIVKLLGHSEDEAIMQTIQIIDELEELKNKNKNNYILSV